MNVGNAYCDGHKYPLYQYLGGSFNTFSKRKKKKKLTFKNSLFSIHVTCYGSIEWRMVWYGFIFRGVKWYELELGLGDS